MKQWDIYLFPHPSAADPHLGIVISNNGICQNQGLQFINVLVCQTVRPPNRPQKPNEIYLDEADGLNWKTLVKCDFIHVFLKSDAGEKRGTVCPQRISELRRKLQELF